MVQGQSDSVLFTQLHKALTSPNTDIKLFGKPEVSGERRMGVALARADSMEEAIERAKAVSEAVNFTL